MLEKKILIADGAIGTMLLNKGLKVGTCPEELNLTHSEIIKNIHDEYIHAGADIILTNTFGANKYKLNRFGLAKDTIKLNQEAINIAKKAAGEKTYIFGDIGPTGIFPKPAGELEYQDFYDAFREQAEVFIRNKLDGIIIETMSDLTEIKAAVCATRDAGKIPIIACATFQKTNMGYATLTGKTPDKIVKFLAELGCNVIGANCSVGSYDMIHILQMMKSSVENLNKSIYFIVQPNAGLPRFKNGKTVYSESVDDFSKAIGEFVKIGVDIIGGCCGTTPEYIRAVKEKVNEGTKSPDA